MAVFASGREGASADAPRATTGFYGVMAVLLLLEIISSLEQSMITSVLPTVVRQFKDVALAGWLVTAFWLASAASAAIGGRLGDLFGRQRVLCIAAAVCAGGSLLSAFVPSLQWMVAGRALQGVSGVILPLCFGITRDIAPRGRAAFWIGVLTGGYAFSAIFGYVLGGMFADRGNWASIFILTATLSLTALPLLLFFVPRDRVAMTGRKLDVVGGVLFAPALTAVLFAVTMAKVWGWTSAPTLSLIAGGVAVLAFWAWYEARHSDPLIDVRLFARRKILIGNLCTSLASFGLQNFPLVFLMLLQQDPRVAGVGLGVSATMAGILKIPSNVSALAASPLSGWLAGKNGARWSVVVGGLINVAAWAAMIPFHRTVPEMVALGAVCSFGSNMLLASTPIMVLEGTPKNQSSETSGLTTAFRSLASAIGSQTIAILLAGSTVLDPKSHAHLPTDAAYDGVFCLIAVSALMVAAFAPLAGPRRLEAGEEV